MSAHPLAYALLLLAFAATTIAEVPAWRRWWKWALLRAYACTRPRLMILAPDGSGYLERWHLTPVQADGKTPRPWWAWLARRYGWAHGKFLHRFHQSDPDRGWHCHPYSWCEAEILRGGYVGARPVPDEYGTFALRMGEGARPGAVAYKPAYTVCRPGDRTRLIEGDYHAVTLLDRPGTPGAVPTWTLFSVGPKHGNSWGFMNREGRKTPAPKDSHMGVGRGARA